MLLNFGEDGSYYAYIVPEDTEISEHYRKAAEYHHWFKIYDDTELTLNISAEQVNVYRASDFDCIIQVINPESNLETL